MSGGSGESFSRFERVGSLLRASLARGAPKRSQVSLGSQEGDPTGIGDSRWPCFTVLRLLRTTSVTSTLWTRRFVGLGAEVALGGSFYDETA